MEEENEPFLQDQLRIKAEQVLNKIIGDVIAMLRMRMEQRISLLPSHLFNFVDGRNFDKMPLVDFLTVGVFKKGALDKSLTDSRKFIGVPKSYVRKLQEI